MKWLRKLFKIGEYDLNKYTRTKIKHYEQFKQSIINAGMQNVTLSYPGPPSINKVFTTQIEGEVYYAYWDKYGILCINNTEGINNSKL